MTKILRPVLCVLFFFPALLPAQTTNAGASLPESENKNRKEGRVVFAPQHPAEDKTEVVEVTGLGKAAFIVSNVADGTPESYRHSQQIIIPLQTAEKSKNYQLVFYGENDKIPYAVALKDGAVNIYYPNSLYSDIKQKLDETFLKGAKVRLKVVQKTSGFSEGVLQF
ncbi:MAG: hypothetical protein ACT4OJ_05545 [Bacteroidota bacterium]